MDLNSIPFSAYDEPVYMVSAGDLWEILGRPLTGSEKLRVAGAIQFSSIPEALATIMFDGLGLRAETELDNL